MKMVIDEWVPVHIFLGALIYYILNSVAYTLILVFSWEVFELIGYNNNWTWEPKAWWEYESPVNRWIVDPLSCAVGILLVFVASSPHFDQNRI